MSRDPESAASLHRREFLGASVAASAAGLVSGLAGESRASLPPPTHRPPAPLTATQFQIACMTLPYSDHTFDRALQGIRGAGYSHVALGTTHRVNGTATPILPANAPPQQARDVAQRCRDAGLQPLMMFSGIYPEAANAVQVLTSRIHQAAAANIPQVLTFGHTQGGNRQVWVERFRQLGPIARNNGVLIVVKQHGGATGTGEACADIVREVNDAGIKVNYDAGNVMDYLRLPPPRVIEDLQGCAAEVHSFCIKDHRDFPAPHGDCGPGLGEIDHYRLLHPVAFLGRTIPLCCENIFAPRLGRPNNPADIDALARRAREFLELVIRGVQLSPTH